MLAERNSFAYEAGSPRSDSYHSNGWLHSCVPHLAWEIPGAVPEGKVGSKKIITPSDRVCNLDKEYATLTKIMAVETAVLLGGAARSV